MPSCRVHHALVFVLVGQIVYLVARLCRRGRQPALVPLAELAAAPIVGLVAALVLVPIDRFVAVLTAALAFARADQPVVLRAVLQLVGAAVELQPAMAVTMVTPK